MMQDESTPSEDAPQSAPEPAASPAPAPAYDFSDVVGFQSLTAATQSEDAAYREQLTKELIARADRFVQSVDDSIVLASDGVIRWLGDPIARLVVGEELLKPRAVLLADEALPVENRDAAERRLSLWIAAHLHKVLGPLEALSAPEGASEAVLELTRKVIDALGVLDREKVRQQVKALDQNARAALRKLGVRFGAYYIFVPVLMKPAARAISYQLWSLKHGSEPGADRLLAYAAAGRTTFTIEGELSNESYRVAGFRLCGERVVRIDIVERLTDLIRAAIPDLMRPGSSGASEAAGFVVSHQMTSLTGCAGEAIATILRSLGFEAHKVKQSDHEATRRRNEPAKIEPIAPASEAAPTEVEIVASSAETEAGSAETSADAAHDGLETGQEPATEALAHSDDAAAEAEAAPAADEAPLNEALPGEPAPEPVAAAAEPEPGVQVSAEALSSPDPSPESESEIESVAADAHASAAAEDAKQELTAEKTPQPESDPIIEVWRPAPRRRPSHTHRRDDNHAVPPEGTGRIVWRARDPKDAGRKGGGPVKNGGFRGRPPEVTQPSQPPADPVEGATTEAPRRDEAPRPERALRNDQRPAYKGPRRDERRDDLAAKGGDRPPRKEPRTPTVDPDSPFAKLMSLRPLLEKRDKRP